MSSFQRYLTHLLGSRNHRSVAQRTSRRFILEPLEARALLAAELVADIDRLPACVGAPSASLATIPPATDADSLTLEIQPAIPAMAVSEMPFEIISPSSGSHLLLGQNVTIQWNGGNPSSLVNIYLIERTPGLPFQTATSVASNVPNSGTFHWTLPASHPLGGPDEHTYDFYISNAEGTSFAYGPFFTVAYPPFEITSPAANTHYSLGQNVTVQWNGGNPARS